MSVRKHLPRCSAAAKDGTQCGRRVKDGSQPPICHLHKPGVTTGTPFVRTLTPLEIIQKLMGDSDPSIRLRAVEMYQKYEDRLASKSQPTDTDDLIARATPEQLSQLRELFSQYKALKAVISLQPLPRVDPDAPPPHVIERWRQEDAAKESRPERQHSQQARPTAKVSEPSTLERATADDGQQVVREKWDEVGLFEENHVVTHSFGDDYANKILRGEIPFEQARQEHADSVAKMNRMGAHVRTL